MHLGAGADRGGLGAGEGAVVAADAVVDELDGGFDRFGEGRGIGRCGLELVVGQCPHSKVGGSPA